MKIIPKSLSLKNFLSFGNKVEEYSFKRGTVTSIKGRNLDIDIGKDNASSNGVGKCLGVDTPVLMYDGTIKMVQDVVIGDLVMGDDGSPRKVLTLASGREPLYRIEQKKGMDYVVNESHVLSLRCGTTRLRRGLTRGEIYNIPVTEYMTLPNHVKTSLCGYKANLTEWGSVPEDLPVDPWILGLWLSDGTSSKPDITFNREDEELIHRFYEYCEKMGYETNITPSCDRKNCFTVSVRGGFLVALREIGVLNNKHVPQLYKNADQATRLAVLAGFVDGDGHKIQNCIEMCLKKNELANDVAFLARSVGLSVTEKDKFSKCPGFDGETYHRIFLSGHTDVIPNVLSRKHCTPRAMNKQAGSTGIKVVPIGEGDYYGFSVDGNHLFCLGDFTVTHNSSLMQAIVYSLYGKGVSDIKQDEFINLTNEKGMVVEFVFEADGKKCVITRCRKPNSVTFTVDGEDRTRDSIANTNEAIQDFIRINYETFLVSFLMTTAVAPILSRKPADQRNFMEDLLGMNILTKRAESIKRLRDEDQIEMRLVERDIENAEKMNQMAQDTFERAKASYDEFEETRKRDMSKNEEILDTYEEHVQKSEEFKHVFERLEKAKEANEAAKDHLREIEKKEASNMRDITRIEKEIADNGKELDDAKRRLLYSEKELEEVEEEFRDTEKAVDDLSESDGEKVELFEKLVAEEQDAENEVAKWQADIDNLDSKIKKSEKEIDHLKDGTCPYCHQDWTTDDKQKKVEQLEDAVADWWKEHQTAVSERDSQEARAKSAADKLEKEGLTQEVVDKITKDFDALDKKLERLGDRSERLKVDIGGLEKKIERLQREVKNVDDLDAELEDLQAYQEKLDEQIDSAGQQCDKALKQFEEVREEAEKLPVSSLNELERILNRVESAMETIENVREKTNPFAKTVDEGPQGLVDVSEKRKEYKEYEVRVTHQKYLIKLLTDSKSFIRRNIINRYIPYLNKMINTYATQLDSPHICEIQSDLTVQIEYMRKSVSYHSLSAGERLRLDVSASIALRDLMSMLGVKSDFLMVDELFDSSLDRNGKTNIFKTIRDHFDTIMLVSHSGEFDDKCDQQLTVVKSNGFSRLEES